MKQVVQPIAGGPVTVLDVPRPTVSPTEVLVRTVASVISPGTERAVTALAQSSLVSKARARPDLVRQVVKKARAEGIGSTLKTVRARLATDLPLGYSAAGVAVEVGSAVAGVRPGQLVATGGAGKANHAEWQSVPGLLCSVVPEGVAPEDAAFTTIASIALHGLRLAEVGPGSKVVVIGLGLIGQLAARLAMASGCDVAGIDVAAEPLRVARGAGVTTFKEAGEATTKRVLAWSRGRGADAVLLCAAGESSSVAQRTPALCRDRAQVVVVGDVGLEISRTPFYERELSLRFARSYGPGRYERVYEEYGVDYPPGHVRWTEGRNFEAVLDMLAAGRLAVSDLVTHRFPIADAAAAYQLIDARREPYLAIALEYPHDQPRREPAVVLRRSPAALREPGVGWIGAGAFSTSVLLPAFQAAGFSNLVGVASASGLSARRMAERSGFARATSADELIEDPDVDVVVVATPHDTHAELTVRALDAGKHVWCEKPLALSLDELDAVDAAWRRSGRTLFVGYNRRWSRAVQMVRDEFSDRSFPLTVVYRVAAGEVPTKHWYHDRRQGGRLLGEVCHFVDTCAALVGSPVSSAGAVAGGRADEPLLADDLAVALAFGDGSVATIGYSSASPRKTAKEHVEVLGGSSVAVIDDYRRVLVDGERVLAGVQDKGHAPAVAAFRGLVTANDAGAEMDALASTRAVLAAAASLSAPTAVY
ncbi:MAG: bi-domain-containing oxidoreductase [Mycobacteriales bacterium]|nr:bi-domain-containing oxidoreductase [Frankia sp.]MCA1833591.1 bi-domain-containing oxidoreductase [Actinomycetota bacterium]